MAKPIIQRPMRQLSGWTLLLLIVSSCTTTAEKNAESLEGQPYVQEIEALGYPFNGEPSKDWRLYETVTFDSAGRETMHVTHWAGMEITRSTTYDAKGRKVSENRNAQDQLGKVDYKVSWSADGLTCVEEEYVHNEGRVLGRTTTRKDSSGKLLQVITENLQFLSSGIDTLMQTYRYDEAGRMLMEEDYHLGKTIPSVRYFRDASGFVVKLERFDSDGKLSRTEYFQNDQKGNVTREWVQEVLEPEKRLVRTMKWNDAGLLIENHEYTGVCTEAGESSGRCRIQQTTRLTYDRQGRPLTKDVFKEGSSSPVMQLRYTYKPIRP